LSIRVAYDDDDAAARVANAEVLNAFGQRDLLAAFDLLKVLDHSPEAFAAAKDRRGAAYRLAERFDLYAVSAHQADET